jgi:hypothetical protein
VWKPGLKQHLRNKIYFRSKVVRPVARYAGGLGVGVVLVPLVYRDQVSSQTVLALKVQTANCTNAALVAVAAFIVKVNPPAIVVLEHFLANVTPYPA